jgi:hypothetical protein
LKGRVGADSAKYSSGTATARDAFAKTSGGDTDPSGPQIGGHAAKAGAWQKNKDFFHNRQNI